MPPTTRYSFGDIVLVPFPFSDHTTTKQRPAVVVSSDAYHRRRIDVVVMAVTSQLDVPRQRAGEVLIAQWQHAGLLKPSLIKPVFATIERRLVLRQLGTLAGRDQELLREAIRQVLG